MYVFGTVKYFFCFSQPVLEPGVNHCMALLELRMFKDPTIVARQNPQS